jgi:hypothetical protein
VKLLSDPYYEEERSLDGLAEPKQPTADGEVKPVLRHFEADYGGAETASESGIAKRRLYLVAPSNGKTWTERDLEKAEPWDPYSTTFFSQLPYWLARQKTASLTAKVVYARLVVYKGWKRTAFPTRKELAECLGLSVRQVDDAIRQLKKFGLIRTRRRGLGKPNTYEFLKHEWIQEDDLTPKGKKLWPS